jgi:hypothetical protein
MYRKLSIGLFFLTGLSLVALALSGTGTLPAQAAPEAIQLFEARLSGEAEAPTPVASPASGRATFVLDEDTNTLHYMVVVYDITGITGAHIHIGAPDEAGPVVFPLFPNGGHTFDPANPINGSLSLDADQLASLLAGNYYVNVHTSEHPAGEIRGQIEGFTPGDFNTLLTGEEETPPVVTDASGWAHFSLNPAADALDYLIHVNDIENVTAAHLHPGWPGEAGPPEINIYLPGDPRDFGPGSPISGSVPISEPEQVLDLISGRYYLNVHTTAHPPGEIRGQVRWGYHPFQAPLSGTEEVPPVETEAGGMSVMVLDADMETLYYRVWVWDITGINGAHIHIGSPGVNGPVVHPLFPNGGDVFDPENAISGELALTPDQVSELVAGSYYVNVHTGAHPGGEIRGQLVSASFPNRAFARLGLGEIAQEPVAWGEARFRINPETGYTSLHYRVEVSGELTPLTAQIHTGQPDEVGPAVLTLFDEDDPRIFLPDSPIVGEREITAEFLRDLLGLNLYVMVHSLEAGMDLRGQIYLEHQLVFPVVMLDWTVQE